MLHPTIQSRVLHQARDLGDLLPSSGPEAMANRFIPGVGSANGVGPLD
jgi:hypothetical protein